MNGVFFDSWDGLLRTLILGLCAYVLLVVMVRISGKRTLSKMNAFDFLVTVALGSVLASVLLGRQTSLAQGLLSFGLLIGCQFLVTWLGVRSSLVRRLVTGKPLLLLHRGEFISDALRRSRVTEGDVLAALRAAGKSDRAPILAVVLETDASLSVIEGTAKATHSTLAGVEGYAGPSADAESA